MAANHHPAQRPHAPPPNRAPQAGQPDLELLPLITDAFIDSLTATEARRWAELAMPATVASAVRKTCTTEHRRDILKFFRDLKRTELKAAAAQPAAPNQAPPEPQAAAPQYGRDVTGIKGHWMIGDFSATTNQSNGSAHPPPFANRQSERDPGALFRERFDAYRGRYPHGGPLGGIPRHSSHINRSASRDRLPHVGPPPPGPRPRGPPPPGPRPRGPPSPGPRPPAAASGGGNAPAANETSSSVNPEHDIYHRAYDAYNNPPPGIYRSPAPAAGSSSSRDDHMEAARRTQEAREAAFAREAGVAARDMHDAGRLHGPGSRGYF